MPNSNLKAKTSNALVAATAALALIVGAAMPLAAGHQGPPPSIPCGCQGLENDISTGSRSAVTALPVGTTDNDWYVYETPNNPAPLSDPAWVIESHPAWAFPPSHSNWINSYSPDNQPSWPDGNYVSAVPGSYTYAIDFNVDFNLYSNYQIDLEYAADDAIEIRLNSPTGTPLLVDSGFSILTAYVYAGNGFVQGTNTLYVTVTNAMLWTGLLVDGSVKARCKVAIDLNTGASAGVPHAIGAPDDDWHALATPTTSTPAPAYSIEPHPAWVTASNANWINPYSTPAGGNTPSAPVGTYTYVFHFAIECLPAACSDASLVLDYTADDVVAISLNGLALGSQLSGWTFLQMHSLASDCSGLRVGMNTLRADVKNAMLWTGFLAEGSLSISY